MARAHPDLVCFSSGASSSSKNPSPTTGRPGSRQHESNLDWERDPHDYATGLTPAVEREITRIVGAAAACR